MSLIKHTTCYKTIPNAIINNPNLSFKAKGLWVYLNSKPDGWNLSISRICKDTLEGENSVRAGLTELRLAGYLFYSPKKDEATGRLAGQVCNFFDTPQETSVKPVFDKTRQLFYD